MKLDIPALLSLNAGYVDTAGFLALQGLFTAHVTGNFVTLGAALVLGSSGVLVKLLALPVFCVVVVAARLAGVALERTGRSMQAMLGAKLVLLVLGAGLAIRLGPFDKGDDLAAIVTGMVLVAAMAIQNTASRVHLASAPPTTLMTGSTTQMMIDLADLLRGLDDAGRQAARARLRKMWPNVAGFAIGCAAGAAAYHFAACWCFALPPFVALLTMLGSPRVVVA